MGRKKETFLFTALKAKVWAPQEKTETTICFSNHLADVLKGCVMLVQFSNEHLSDGPQETACIIHCNPGKI